MAFIAEDLYTVSSGIRVTDYWNPYVTKHDTSSFYNWEQDNLPLYDLEERTNYLWEKLGWPTSSLPGMVLAVSSSIPTNLEVSCNFFTDLSSAVKALPEIIRMPTLIEVCTSGSLGGLDLDNIKCEGDGKLEIVNRLMIPVNSASSISRSVTKDTITTISSLDIANTIVDASCLLASATTLDFAQITVGSKYPVRGFTQIAYNGNSGAYRPAVMSASVFQRLTSSTNVFYTIDSRSGVGVGSTWETLDTSTYAETDNGLLVRTTPATNANEPIHGFLTSNYLTHINISNCDGPIFVRGFITDPAQDSTSEPFAYYPSESSMSGMVGIKVSNCDNLTLERCGSTRAKEVGCLIENSKVYLRRGFGASRNYEPLSTTEKHTRKTYGLKAVNSEVTIKPDTYVSGLEYFFNIQAHDIGIMLENSVLNGGQSRNDDPDYTIVNSSFNLTGIEAINSEVDLKGYLSLYNNGTGLKALGSTLKLDNMWVEMNQSAGFDLVNSNVIYNTVGGRESLVSLNETLTLSHNYQIGFCSNGRHLKMSNSSFKPKKQDLAYTKSPYSLFALHMGVETSGLLQTNLVPGIELDNSKCEIVYGRLVTPGGDSSPISYKRGSVVDGALVRANNNSEVLFRGGKYAASILVGPNGVLNQTKSSGVSLNSNSSCRFSGPTLIGQFGVDVLADNNSTVKFEPHRTDDGTGLDVSSWGLNDPQNHTAVELHATRSCLVANNGSNIVMEDMGDYHSFWERDEVTTSVSSSDYGTGAESASFNTSSFCSAGGMVFLPNPNDESLDYPAHLPTTKVLYNSTNSAPETPTTIGLGQYVGILTNTWGTIAEDDFINTYSMGGMCLRALNGSRVKVSNVHFIPGPTLTDKEYYDPSATGNNGGCYNLRIWNIGPGSYLDSSYCSVSGTYPSFANYVGPHSTFIKANTERGLGDDSSSVAYNAFEAAPFDLSAGHPDVSTLSVLDFFGSGVQCSAIFSDKLQGINAYRSGGNTSYFGLQTPENRGPFRLFFSVNPAAKDLFFASGTPDDFPVDALEDNRPYQLLSQGYFLSGTCSGYEGTASGLHLDLFTVSATAEDASATFALSGYYHPSSFVDPSYAQRVMLDESAANTFANAKHCSIDFLGRPRLVTLYRATTTPEGESASPVRDGFGRGFKSSNIFDLKRDN